MDKRAEIYYPEDTLLNIFTKPKKYLKNSYARVFLDEMVALGLDKELSGNDLRVLLAIIGNLDYENQVNISQQELGNQLDIHQVSISKSLKKLINKGYLKIIDTIGRQNIYQFNPHLVFRGYSYNHKHLCRTWDEGTTANTRKSPIDIDTDLDLDLEDKLDDKVSQLSKQFGVPQSKVRQIILSLVNQALENKAQEDIDVPY